MCKEIDNVLLWSGKGRKIAQITITEQTCYVVMSCLLFDPQIFKKRIITFIRDFSDLQFILERHLIRWLAGCAQSMGKILSKALHLHDLSFEVYQELNFHSKSNYPFILASLNNSYHHKAFPFTFSPACIGLFFFFNCISRCLIYLKSRYIISTLNNPGKKKIQVILSSPVHFMLI